VHAESYYDVLYDFNDDLKSIKTSSRVRNRARSVKISSTAHGLTSQAGLIPVVKYLDRIGFDETVKRGVAHPRGDNADYHLSDAVLLTLVGSDGFAQLGGYS